MSPSNDFRMTFLIVGSQRISSPPIRDVISDPEKGSRVTGVASGEDQADTIRGTLGTLQKDQIVNVVMEDNLGREFSGAAKIGSINFESRPESNNASEITPKPDS